MIVITKLIMIGIAIVCAVTLAFIVLEFVEDKVKSTSSKKINRVHFYVARDKCGDLWIYIGKPIRGEGYFYSNGHSISITRLRDFSKFGLDANDYVNLTWEDEPVEVFLNMGD